MIQDANPVVGPQPLVSVIIPAFNVAKYLNRALASVASQTYSNVEILVIDDGSTDETGPIARSFADSRIVYRYQKNAGQGPARNHGMRIARGDFITFLDADDYYLPTKIEEQVTALREHPERSACYCGVLNFYSDRPAELLYRFRGYSGNIFPELVTFATFVQPNTLMIRREVVAAVGYWNETRYYPEDWDYSLRIAKAGFSFHYVDNPLVAIELRPGSNTSMDIQWILKTNQLGLIRSLSEDMSDSERRKYRIPELIESTKAKLAVAYLIVGNRREYTRTVLSMKNQLLAIPSRLFIPVLWLMPVSVVRRMAMSLWEWHTRRTFAAATA
jgi:glycosyltransferase involved in cell wall biosynthesis